MFKIVQLLIDGVALIRPCLLKTAQEPLMTLWEVVKYPYKPWSRTCLLGCHVERYDFTIRDDFRCKGHGARQKTVSPVMFPILV